MSFEEAKRAEAVARQAPCPVWLAPAREKPLQLLVEPWETPRSPLGNLLVPLDTSPLADRALDFVRVWPSARWARLVLLAATDMRPPDRKLNAGLRAHLRHCLEERAAPLLRAVVPALLGGWLLALSVPVYRFALVLGLDR